MNGISPGARIAVGSLPYFDPLAAVQFQLRFFPEIPAWPQLPKRSPKEWMARQGLSGLPGLIWDDLGKGLWTLSTDGAEEVLEILVEENESSRLSRAAFQSEEAPGFGAFLEVLRTESFPNLQGVKGQCVGPITLGLHLKDEAGKALIHSRTHMEVLVEYLLMQARWQSRQLAGLGKPVVFFIDEPGVGNGFDPTAYGLASSDLDGWYDSFFSRLQDEAILTGVHCCGSGPWDGLFRAPAEIIHLDAFRYFGQADIESGACRNFLRKGGLLGWGLVPTRFTRGAFPEPAELMARWMEGARFLTRQGIPSPEIRDQSFFSSACGFGMSEPAVVEEAARCLDGLTTIWRVEVQGDFDESLRR